MTKKFCNVCKKAVSHPALCADCGSDDDKHYHKTCLLEVNGRQYCPKDFKSHRDNGVLISYLKQTWQRLGVGGTLSINGNLEGENVNATVFFGQGLSFTFKVEWDTYYAKLRLFRGESLHEVKLHQHSAVRKALKEVVSLAISKDVSEAYKEIEQYERRARASKRHLARLQRTGDIVSGVKKLKKSKPKVEVNPELDREIAR